MTRAINRTDAECIAAACSYMHRTRMSIKIARRMVKAVLNLCPTGSIRGVEISTSGPGMETKSVKLDSATADNASAILRGLKLIGEGK